MPVATIYLSIDDKVKFKGIECNYYNSKYTYTDNKVSFAKYMYYNSDFWERRITYCTDINLSPELNDRIINTASKVILKLDLTQDYHGNKCYLGILSSNIGNLPEDKYYNCFHVKSSATFSDISGHKKTYTYTTTNKSDISNIFNYGFVINPDDSVNTSIQVGGIMEVIYDGSYDAPEITSTVEYNSYGQSITEPFKLSWDYSQNDNVSQKYIDLDIKNYGEDDIYYVNLLSKYPLTAHEYTIQPNQYLPPTTNNTLYKVRWRVYSQNNVVSNYVEETIITFFPHADLISPINGAIELAADTIYLKWDVKASYKSSSGYGYDVTVNNFPTKFDIQYSTNNGENWNELATNIYIQRENNIYTYSLPPNTFPNGIITWRVRPYVNGNTIDDFVQNVFLVRVQASTSSVTCNGKPHPTLSWTSSSQVAYQVKFADFDSGAIYGTEHSYTLPYFYADNNYPIQVRTQASNGEWSEWTEVEYVTIKNTVVSGTVSLTAQITRHAVVLNWTGNRIYTSYILYRDDIPIYIGTDNVYTDSFATGNVSYYVRGIVSDASYVVSVTKNILATPKTDCICDIAIKQWYPLKYSLQAQSRSYSANVQTYFQYYAGRTKPIAFTENQSERKVTASYAFKDRADAKKIMDLSGKTVIFKDSKGGMIIGVLNSTHANVSRVYELSIEVREIDYEEDVKYET